MTPRIIEWPKQTFYWRENNTLCASTPFTWELPKVRMVVCQKQIFDQWEKVIVGGPAVQLMPDYFSDLEFVEIGQDCPGILQRINPQATRTTAGCPEGGIVLDPFMGSGTTAVVSKFLKRNFIGIELNPRDVEMAEDRIAKPFKPRVVRKKKARDPQMRLFGK